jgi:hypothetical protein
MIGLRFTWLCSKKAECRSPLQYSLPVEIVSKPFARLKDGPWYRLTISVTGNFRRMLWAAGDQPSANHVGVRDVLLINGTLAVGAWLIVTME